MPRPFVLLAAIAILAGCECGATPTTPPPATIPPPADPVAAGPAPTPSTATDAAPAFVAHLEWLWVDDEPSHALRGVFLPTSGPPPPATAAHARFGTITYPAGSFELERIGDASVPFDAITLFAGEARCDVRPARASAVHVRAAEALEMPTDEWDATFVELTPCDEIVAAEEADEGATAIAAAAPAEIEWIDIMESDEIPPADLPALAEAEARCRTDGDSPVTALLGHDLPWDGLRVIKGNALHVLRGDRPIWSDCVSLSYAAVRSRGRVFVIHGLTYPQPEDPIVDLDAVIRAP